jgi:uncharacterized cupin superfamily protein
VLEGAAQVILSTGETLELTAGVVGMFHGGERTIWKVREPLRKVYHLLGENGSSHEVGHS